MSWVILPFFDYIKLFKQKEEKNIDEIHHTQLRVMMTDVQASYVLIPLFLKNAVIRHHLTTICRYDACSNDTILPQYVDMMHAVITYDNNNKSAVLEPTTFKIREPK